MYMRWFVGTILLVALAAPIMAKPTEEKVRVQDLDRDQQAVAREVIGSIWSPYCPGMTLESCTSGKAEVLRHEVREMAARGMTYAEIENELAKRFGDNVRAVPPMHGKALIIWMAPYAALLVGLLLVILLLRNWNRKRHLREETGDSAPEVRDPDANARIDDLLAREKDL